MQRLTSPVQCFHIEATSAYVAALGTTKFPGVPLGIEIVRLLARVPMVHDACDFDLFLFFHRYPRTLLTNEELAALVGCDINQIAKPLEAFIEASTHL
jgi:hypothetical protein